MEPQDLLAQMSELLNGGIQLAHPSLNQLNQTNAARLFSQRGLQEMTADLQDNRRSFENSKRLFNVLMEEFNRSIEVQEKRNKKDSKANNRLEEKVAMKENKLEVMMEKAAKKERQKTVEKLRTLFSVKKDIQIDEGTEDPIRTILDASPVYEADGSLAVQRVEKKDLPAEIRTQLKPAQELFQISAGEFALLDVTAEWKDRTKTLSYK